MKILSIGNSFSQDAQRYLYLLSRDAGIPVKSVNLMIGGCPLSKHYRNLCSERSAYNLEVNGEATFLPVSIKDALLSDDWDYVTFQQLSSAAPNYDTYQPYLNELSAYVKRLAPKAKQIIHQTWAYEEGSRRLVTEMKYAQPEDMLKCIIDAYVKAADAIDAFGTIPSGVAMLKAYRLGATDMQRDTFHAGLTTGRLLLAELWLTCLSGQDLREVRIPRLDAPISDADVAIVRQVAYDAAVEYGWIKN